MTNAQPFTGGQDERNFSTVDMQDITRVVTPLTTAVTRSVTGAFQGQRNPDERFQILPCASTVASDHPIGQEATQVTITVSETCRAVAYNEAAVEARATELLARQAAQQVGTDYRLFGSTHMNVARVTVNTAAKPQVLLSFSASGAWVFGLSQQTQAQITNLLVGKTTQQAMQLLAALPGVEQASIRLTGLGDATRLPRQSSLIHLVFVVV